MPAGVYGHGGRHRRDSAATSARGRDLLVHAKEIVEAHDPAVDHTRRSELSGALRLGCSGTELPRAVFVLRSRPRVEGNELIDALRGHLSEILTSTHSPDSVMRC